MPNILNLSYTVRVPKTNGTGFDSPNVVWRTCRPYIYLAAFLRPYASVRLLWAGTGGGTFGCAGIHTNRSVNPTCCPPASFDSEARVLSNSYGGRHG